MTLRRLLALGSLCLASPVWADGTSTTHVWFPSRPLTAVGAAATTFGEQQCHAWVPDLGITGGTTVAWYITTGFGVGKKCTVTVYTANGSAQIVTTGPQDCSTSGTVVVTGLGPFAWTAGTKLWVCLCGTAGGSVLTTNTGPSLLLRDFRNALSVPLDAASANDCTAGVAPASTGALTAASARLPFYVLFATGTP